MGKEPEICEELLTGGDPQTPVLVLFQTDSWDKCYAVYRWLLDYFDVFNLPDFISAEELKEFVEVTNKSIYFYLGDDCIEELQLWFFEKDKNKIDIELTIFPEDFNFDGKSYLIGDFTDMMNHIKKLCNSSTYHVVSDIKRSSYDKPNNILFSYSEVK